MGKRGRGRAAWMVAALLAGGLAGSARAGDNLKINPGLNYSGDSQDGPLITGDHMDEGAVSGQPNYVIFYGEG